MESYRWMTGKHCLAGGWLVAAGVYLDQVQGSVVGSRQSLSPHNPQQSYIWLPQRVSKRQREQVVIVLHISGEGELVHVPHELYCSVHKVHIFLTLSPQSTHRVAIADFWRASHHDGKISAGWWGWRGMPTPFHYICHQVQLVAVYAPAQRADTLTLLHLYSYVLCGGKGTTCMYLNLQKYFILAGLSGDAQLRASVKSSFPLPYVPSLKITAGEPGLRSSQPMPSFCVHPPTSPPPIHQVVSRSNI